MKKINEELIGKGLEEIVKNTLNELEDGINQLKQGKRHFEISTPVPLLMNQFENVKTLYESSTSKQLPEEYLLRYEGLLKESFDLAKIYG